MCERKWEITEMFGAWWVQVEGSFRVDDEVLVCEGLTKEQAMAIAAASGRVFTSGIGELQRWEVPE